MYVLSKPQENNKMKNIKNIIALIAAVTVTAAFTAGCSDSDKDSGTSGINVVYYDSSNSNSYVTPQDEDSEAKANAKNIEGNISEKTTLSGCEITVTKVLNIGERPADSLHKYAADMMVAKLEITNNNEETISVNSIGDFNISVDGSNEVIGLDLNASVAAVQRVDDYQSFDCDIKPGEKAEGYINFEAKQDWKELVIRYTPHTSDKSYDSVSYKVTPDMVEEL